MLQDPPSGSGADLELKRRQMVGVLRAGAEWLASVTDEKLPPMLKRLEGLVDELARCVKM